ncbi:hypothetical protein S245_041143, partial [Arachis hypogaea]
DMGELPSNFYRRFHDELASLLTFADCAGNELQVLIEKGPRTGIIVNGFRNFSSFYGLKLGGWLKVSYVGSNHFIINEVIDHNMKVKEFSSPPFKVSLDIKPTVGFDSVIDISKESSLLSSVHVKDLSYKSPQPYSINESFYTVNSTNLLPSDNNNSVVPLDICLQLQSTPQILNTTHVPSFANDNFFDRAHYSNIPTQFHQEPLHFPFIHNEKQSNFSLDLYKTRCHSVMRTHPLSHDDYSFAIGNDISNSVSDFVLAHNPNPPNEFPLPPPPLPSSIVSPVVYSIVKVLSPFQSKHYAMLLPARFAVRAFSRKLDFVNVIQLTGPSIRMKLRWRDIRPNEVFLTKGWRKFCRNHKLVEGSVLRFSVSSIDETTIEVMSFCYGDQLCHKWSCVQRLNSLIFTVNDLDVSSDQQNWRIKVRVIKIWSLSAVEDKYRKPMLEFIVMDQLENMPLENSEIQSAQSEFDVTPINNSSQSCEIINLDSTQDIVTPKRSITSLECSKNLSEVFSDLDNSSCSKSRRITKEPTISVGKEHVQPEFPSIFYRRYKDQLSERVFFIDLNENLVELIIGICQSAGYILFGFDNLIRLFGLENGGWLKLIYVGENVFIITKVKDVSMIKKPLPDPPTKLFLDPMCHPFVNNNVTDPSLNVLSLQPNPNIVIDISSDSSMNSDVPPYLDQFYIDGVMSDIDVINSIPSNRPINDGVNSSLVSINNPLNNFHQGQQQHALQNPLIHGYPILNYSPVQNSIKSPFPLQHGDPLGFNFVSLGNSNHKLRLPVEDSLKKINHCYMSSPFQQPPTNSIKPSPEVITCEKLLTSNQLEICSL